MSLVHFKSKVHTTKKKNRKIEFIVVHYAECTSSPKNAALNKAKLSLSSCISYDYIIDDNNIVQCNLDIKNTYTHHLKSKKDLDASYIICTNANSISVELCSKGKFVTSFHYGNPNFFFSEKVLESATSLIAKLMLEYDIPVENIVRVRPYCVNTIHAINELNNNDFRWNEFKNNVNIRSKDYKIAILEAENSLLKSKIDNIKQSITE